MSEHDFPEVMLDLETMGNGPNAAIVAIGAVAFSIERAEISPRGFYGLVTLESAVWNGGKMDAPTVIWWLQQPDEAREEITREDLERKDMTTVLAEFAHWIEVAAAGQDSRVWGNGAGFDNVILRSAYERALCTPPWIHWNDRCYRTVKALHLDVKIDCIGIHHHALDDATSQALHLIRMLRPEYRDAPANFAFQIEAAT